MREYVGNVLHRWRTAFGCGDVDDVNSVADLNERTPTKKLFELSDAKADSKDSSWLRRMTDKFMGEDDWDSLHTDSTVGSPSDSDSFSSGSQDDDSVNCSRPKDSPMPSAIETKERTNSLTNTDLTTEYDDEELIAIPVPRAHTFQETDLPSYGLRSNELTPGPIMTERVRSLPNTSSVAFRKLQRTKPNPERAAFFQVVVYDAAYEADTEGEVSEISGNTQKHDDNAGWPDDFYTPQ